MAKTRKEGVPKSVFTVVILIAVGGLLAFGMLGTSINAEENILKITGLHSQKILYSDMESIELMDELPIITAKTGGFSMAGKRLGSFTTNEYGKVKLFLFNNIGPFIYIEKANGDIVILNNKEPDLTNKLYDDISSR